MCVVFIWDCIARYQIEYHQLSSSKNFIMKWYCKISTAYLAKLRKRITCCYLTIPHSLDIYRCCVTKPKHIYENFHENKNNIYISIAKDIMSFKQTRTNQMKWGKGLHILIVRYQIKKQQWGRWLMLRLNGHHFAEDIFECIFLNKNCWISNTCWIKYFPYGPVGNISPLAQILAWYRTGDKPLSDPMMTQFIYTKQCHRASTS